MRALVAAALAVIMVPVVTLGDTPLLPFQPLLGVLAIACGLTSMWLDIIALRSWEKGDGPVAPAGVLFLWQMGYWNVLAF